MKNRESEAITPVRVMSSNALFDSSAAERAPRLIENYLFYKPDLLGLQEINRTLQEVLIGPMRERGYSVVSARPDESRRKDFEHSSLSAKYPSVNYVPILYNSSRFEEVWSDFYMYRSTWTPTKGVTAAVFRERGSGRLLAHINTHAAILLSSYEVPDKTPRMSEEWRIDNCRQIIGTWKEISAKYGGIPVLITGDFNSNENSESYSGYIAAGLRNAKYVAEHSASRNIGSFHALGAMPLEGKDSAPIDHIFVTPEGVRVLRHSIETRREVLEASDHCMILADVELI